MQAGALQLPAVQPYVQVCICWQLLPKESTYQRSLPTQVVLTPHTAVYSHFRPDVQLLADAHAMELVRPASSPAHMVPPDGMLPLQVIGVQDEYAYEPESVPLLHVRLSEVQGEPDDD